MSAAPAAEEEAPRKMNGAMIQEMYELIQNEEEVIEKMLQN